MRGTSRMLPRERLAIEYLEVLWSDLEPSWDAYLFVLSNGIREMYRQLEGYVSTQPDRYQELMAERIERAAMAEGVFWAPSHLDTIRDVAASVRGAS